MRKKITLVLVMHNHQPVGNFDQVFEECFSKCYKPFVKVLEKFPHMKTSIHFTGSLLQWIETHHEDYFELLNTLIANGQLELMGGGFYEPILSMLPQRDAIGQLKLHSSYLEKHFNYTPKGSWLAERVWDANMPEILSKVGIKYTIVDDTHFKYAGFNQEDIHGYYISEKLGHKVAVFPIDKNLRYMIPFVEPQKVIDYLSMCAEKFPDSSVCYADDGEKFGSWPGTYHSVYEEKWLERFYNLLREHQDWIEVKQAGEVIESKKPRGLVYLPNASYEEMLEWALPLNAAFRYKIMKNHLESLNVFGQYKDFIRGGTWPNFLVKYPESNLMYRKMLYVSNKVNKADVSDDIKFKAMDELYQGQCNCSYWHGLFGGLYLNYLRHAVYTHLLNAERIVSKEDRLLNLEGKLSITRMDYTTSGIDEFVVENNEMFALINQNYGGTLVELDHKGRAFNFSNVMTRRKEAYHLGLMKDVEKNGLQSSESKISTDKITVRKEADAGQLDKLLCYDKYSKFSFIDHFYSTNISMQDLKSCVAEEMGDFVGQPYQIVLESKKTIAMKRNGKVTAKALPVSIEKEYQFSDEEPLIKVNYKIKNNSQEPLNIRFGCEFNFTLLAGRDEKRFYEINENQLQGEDKFMISQGEIENVTSFAFVDLWNGLKLRIESNLPSKLFRYPVETVSQSESGLEKQYQGSSLLPTWLLNIDVGSSFEVAINLKIQDLSL